MFKSKSRSLFTAFMLVVMLAPGFGASAVAAPVGAPRYIGAPLQGVGPMAQSVDSMAQSAQSWAEFLKQNNIDEATYGSNPHNPSPKGVMPYDGGPVLGPMPAYQGAVVVPPCDTPGAIVKTFNISAIDVVIMINRFGDNNPQGKMYVMDENIPAVRAREALPLTNPDRVDIGLRDDPIQPLVIRANVGECVVVSFTNRLALGMASMNVRGLGVAVSSQGANVGLNPDTLVAPGQSITYKWNIPDGGQPGPDPLKMEGSYVFSSLGNPRQQQAHGLFGVINVERRGSFYINPNTGLPQKSGWEAIIVDPSGKDFREDTIMYHEFGDETFDLSQAGGSKMPTNDALGSYRPGSRLLNYRSEPFFRRMELAETSPRLGQADESQSYGSYMFGDPATPFPRGYVGDPTKRRIVHPGSERFHSEHLHGGSIRWPLDPFAEADKWGAGLDKRPQGQFLSQRLDVQAVGPGETYTEQMESAAGGLQAGPGEYLFHCHFPQHYIGGMWAFWRVFDTLQTTATTQPGQPPLVELLDRAGLTPQAVNSVALLGTALPSGKILAIGATTATTKNIDEWMRGVLPPQGTRTVSPTGKLDYDASVWDWTVQNDAQGRPSYLSEPDDTTTWVNWKGAWASSFTADHRRAILFNPRNGRPAFPLLRPHLATRPPFAPGRSGSPYLGEPDADHPDSLIPSDARRLQYTVVAKPMPIIFNNGPDGIAGTGDDLADPAGLLLVLDEDKDAILAGQKPKEQLTIRANVGDGVDVTYYSEEPSELQLPEGPAMAKTNIHIHFVQFDTQASDGVVSGLSYEQTVRPYATEGGATGDVAGPGIRLAQTANVGSNTITVDNAATLKVNAFVGIGFGVAANQPNGFEFAQIRAKNGNTLTLDRQLQKSHPAGQFAGTEFVRYQWYADIEDGTTFFHDHVFGIPGFGKALTGVLVQEPRDSLWLDPTTGDPIRSGTKAVIQTNRQVSPGVPIQSFREFVLHNMGAITALAENNASVSADQPGGFNMRTEPLPFRLANNPDPSLVFSSAVHGDPATPVLRAYVGDLVALRMIQTSGHDAVGFHLAGHRFRMERFDPREEPKDGLTMVIAERFDLFFTAGSVGLQPGDYVYMNPMNEKMQDGAWGILRVHDKLQNDLLPIRAPGPPVGAGFPQLTPCTNPNKALCARPPAASEPQTLAELATKLGSPLVATMPVRTFNVNAIELPITFDGGGDSELRVADGRAYVLAEDEAAVRAGTKTLEPLVLRANVGEAVKVVFTNKLPNARASFHIAQTMQTTDSLGSAFGFNNDSTVAPGQSKTQWYVIDSRFEVPRSFNITDYGEPISGPVNGHYTSGAAKGLYGAFVIEPTGSTFHDPKTGAVVSSGVTVDVRNPSLPGGGFRDVVLIFQDNDQIMNRDVMPYRAEVRGLRGINYKALPVAERKAVGVADDDVFKNRTQTDDPRTTLIQTTSGDPVRLHVIGGPGHQPHVFSLDGHRFPFDPGRSDLMKLASRLFGPMTTIDAALEGGAGGGMCTPGGDFMYNDRRGPFLESGLWGIMRVAPPSQATVLPLMDLAVGWNLVSRNVLPANTSTPQFLASIAGKFDMVAALDPNDPGKWQTYSPLAAQNTLTGLDQTKGFWIHMTQPAFLSPAGILPARTDIPLKAGWNLVGWPSNKTVPVAQALAPIAGKFDLVFAYDANDTADHWKRYDPTAPAFANDLINVRPLLGYWIHMAQAGTLSVVNP